MKVNKPIESKKETNYLLIVDSSSSMNSLRSSTISGINEQIDMIKDLQNEFPDQEYYMSFVHFNSVVKTEYIDRKPEDLLKIDESNYICSGMTALVDAIGISVNELSVRMKDKVDSTAIVVIITDGEENSSNDYTSDKVKSMISELQSTNRWTFSFIGANIDSVSTAGSYGINSDNVVNFSSNVNSNSRVYGTLSKSMKSRAVKFDNLGYMSTGQEFISDEDKDLR